MKMHWLTECFLATALLIPCWLLPGFFGKNFKVSPETFLFWYCLGTASFIFATGMSSTDSVLVPSWKTVLAILLAGLCVGGLANTLLFRAVAHAPNPGFALGISQLTSLGVFFLSASLCKMLPDYFEKGDVSVRSLIGLCLSLIGVVLVIIR